MRRLVLTTPIAILAATLLAGTLDISAVFAFWIVRDMPFAYILPGIASSVIGSSAYERGIEASALGLGLHYLVSFFFAAAYVIACLRLTLLRTRPILFGLSYGALAYVIMTFVVVPLSLAEFGDWPPPLINLAASVFIHLFFFGLPIALVSTRLRTAGLNGH